MSVNLGCVLCRSTDTIPISADLDPQLVASFWDQARLYKDKRITRGKSFQLLMANPQWRDVITAFNLNAVSIYNKLKKESYAKGAPDLIMNDARMFVEAGLLMHHQGDGFFK